MPQECLNFCMNSLVCIFFSLLVGTPIDKAHDLAFPQISLGSGTVGGALGGKGDPPSDSTPQHTLQPLSSLTLFTTNDQKKNNFPSITVYSLENATRLWFWIFMKQDSEKRDSRDTVALDDLLTLTPCHWEGSIQVSGCLHRTPALI